MKLNGNYVAVIGLGYVGLPPAVEFGKSRAVIGIDISPARIAELRSGKDSTREVSPEDLQAAGQLRYSNQLDDLADRVILIVAVPTPIDKANLPDLTPLITASETVGKAMRAGLVVIYESTVYRGCTEEVCVPVLVKFSGLEFNVDFFSGYSPERINQGDKVNTLTKIRKITSGSTPEVGKAADARYAIVITAVTVSAASLKGGRVGQSLENTQSHLGIALVNELLVIFDRLEIDPAEVLEATGSKWNFLPIRPGMVGGHCIGVDPCYVTHKAEEVGCHPQVILAGRHINDNMARYAARNVIRLMLKNGVDVTGSAVGLQGITFKENCPDIRNSKVADRVHELEGCGVTVVASDPWADAEGVFQEFGIRHGTIDAAKPVDSLIVAVANNEFRRESLGELGALCRGDKPVLDDLEALYDRHASAGGGFSVFRL